MLSQPPLSLYVHLPWCVHKCPYCDFNSHALKGSLPESAYVAALLSDLELDLPQVWGRTVQSVFIGGGTPSLFSASAIAELMNGLRARLSLAPNAEITMEANPGTVEHDRFEGYLEAGINRISLGIQSFNDQHLKILGRIHGGDEAKQAIDAVQRAGFERINLDLMWGLPSQSPEQALQDLESALAFAPGHVSHYQLTLEPNTVFAAQPPVLPDEDTLWAMQETCATRLTEAGFNPYEISAWCQPEQASQHNLNYWRFGDYLGIGAGAHGKLTLPAEARITRTRRRPIPTRYLAARADRSFIAEQRDLDSAERAFDFFLNHLRLAEPCPVARFETRTGLTLEDIATPLARAIELGLLEHTDAQLIRTADGARCLNDLQALFLPS